MKLKGKILNIDELNAYRIAYGNPIQRKELIISLMVPFLISFFYTFILFYYWWLSLIVGIAAMIYARVYTMPYREKRIYEENSFRERNNFVNNMTQILTNEERTILQSLKTVGDRANGEFREDIEKLQAKIVGATNEEVQGAFQELIDKYQKDVIFTLYLEQIITIIVEGKINIETLKDIKSYYNEIKKKQDKFFIEKQQRQKDFKQMIKLGILFIFILKMSFGWRQFIDVYAHHPIGWVASFLYLIILMSSFYSFLKRMGDDSIMEVQV